LVALHGTIILSFISFYPIPYPLFVYLSDPTLKFPLVFTYSHSRISGVQRHFKLR
jgi:hypothetical protein